MPNNGGLTPREIERAIDRIDARLDSFSAVTTDVFAAELRVQGEIHERHRDSIEKLSDQIDANKADLQSDVDELRGWLKWLFTLLVTNLVTLLAMVVTATVMLL